MRSAELFAGCGGLALGMSRAGFHHTHMAEFDQDAVSTVLHNKAKGIEHVRDWPMGLQDVRDVDWRQLTSLDLISGGPLASRSASAEKKRVKTIAAICGLKRLELSEKRSHAWCCSRTLET